MTEDARFVRPCADLVSERRFEPGLRCLFECKSAGEWVPVGDLYRSAGQAEDGLPSTLAAAWLPTPTGDTGYAVVLFLDAESQWSTTAHYNVSRLTAAPRSAAPRG